MDHQPVSTPYKSGMVVSPTEEFKNNFEILKVSTPYKSGMVVSLTPHNVRIYFSEKFQPPINRGWWSHAIGPRCPRGGGGGVSTPYKSGMVVSHKVDFSFPTWYVPRFQPPINRGWWSHIKIDEGKITVMNRFQPPINRGWWSHSHRTSPSRHKKKFQPPINRGWWSHLRRKFRKVMI